MLLLLLALAGAPTCSPEDVRVALSLAVGEPSGRPDLDAPARTWTYSTPVLCVTEGQWLACDKTDQIDAEIAELRRQIAEKERAKRAAAYLRGVWAACKAKP